MRADPAAADPLEMLRRNPWFAGLSADIRAAFVDGGRLVALAKGQWLYSEGDASKGLVVILSGRLRLMVAVGGERDVLFDIVGPGAIVGHAAGFGGEARLATVRAGAATSVFTISDSVLTAITAAHPSFSRSMSELLYASLSYALVVAAGALCLSPRAKVAGRLILLTERQLDGDPDFAGVTQADLAEMTGLSRKSVQGHLAALRRAGIAQPVYGGVRILDPARLRALI
jgi:CRP/FNR family transcriptional regulator, cyclic AMP receptor protein